MEAADLVLGEAENTRENFIGVLAGGAPAAAEGARWS